MRHFLKKQTGATLIAWLVLIAILGLMGLMGLKLFPVYFNDMTVGSVLASVAEDPDSKAMSNRELWSSINKRLSINELDDLIESDDVNITSNEGITTITIEYEVRTDLIGNLDSIASFEHAAVIE